MAKEKESFVGFGIGLRFCPSNQRMRSKAHSSPLAETKFHKGFLYPQEQNMSEEKGTYAGEIPQDNTYQIRDEATPRDYFSQIPNIVDIMELSPHAYRLYGHLRRVAGESGRCWQSTGTLARSCNMSEGMVSKSKGELEHVYPPLIRIESKKFDRGSYHEIAITDIWEINHAFYTGANLTIKTANGVVFHNMNEWRSQYELDRSQYETKKNPVKEEPVNGDKSPDTSKLPIEWQIAAGAEQVTLPDQMDARRWDIAQLIGMGEKSAAIELAYAFMKARDILIPESKIKGQRKAVREMIEMGVQPEHVTEAVRQLLAKNMTVIDLFSVSKTAQDLANKKEVYTGERKSHAL